jgi:Domain of unknown function (DUF4251)
MVYKYFAKAALLSVFTITGVNTLDAQENDSLIQRKIRSQEYFFVPQSASSSIVTVPINSVDYGVRITTDSVIAVLPYNGKSYTVQNSPMEKEIKFISTNFKYTSVAKKKGKWEITIEPKDARGIRLFLIIFNDGNANMDVISPGNETMLFKGYVW